MKRANEKEMMQIIRQRRLRWVGHIFRMKDNRIPKCVHKWNPPGKRKRGRPNLSWRESVGRDLKNGGLSWMEAEELAQDRRTWQFVTAQCANSTGRTKV